MGLFSSSSKTDTTSTYSNPTMKEYTSAYRGMAPWAFATLDPTATLAAMGNTGQLGGVDLGTDFRKTLAAMSADEQKQFNLGNKSLDRIVRRQKSGQFLTPHEQEFINQSLDKAFEYAHTVGYKDWQLGAQSLAGSRGLRTSDTPVAAPAMAELRNFELGLGSQRAKMGLDATMQMSQQQNAFDEGIREFQQNLMANKWQVRQGFMFGGGAQGASMIGSTTHQVGKTTGNPSLMSSIGQTIGVAQQATDLIGSWGSGISGIPTNSPTGR